ncbi:MAG: DNA lyase [Deltaproteobacteria bacterium]|nr:MAG: DNA lyase [Deltaproteobacteria bacterium]
MRLWSLHPKYLDAKGLVAFWREGLLAKAVLEGRTRGYRHHPQLDRFREQDDPVGALTSYLHAVCDEASRRGYRFDRSRLGPEKRNPPIPVTEGQLLFEQKHLLEKLKTRDRERFKILSGVTSPKPHPLFTVVPGGVMPWEKGA